jgi:hypothetical protein
MFEICVVIVFFYTLIPRIGVRRVQRVNLSLGAQNLLFQRTHLSSKDVICPACFPKLGSSVVLAKSPEPFRTLLSSAYIYGVET